jgi:predicted nucleic acid-binding protein
MLVDASVWVAAVVPSNPESKASQRLLRETSEPLWMLDLALYEAANAVAVKYRQPEDARKLTRAMLRRSGRYLVRCDADLLDEVANVAHEHGLTAYDAAYVAAAKRNRWQLVSIDHRDLVSKGLAVTPDAALYP